MRIKHGILRALVALENVFTWVLLGTTNANMGGSKKSAEGDTLI